MGTHEEARQAKFTALKAYYLRAAAYDVAYARKADSFARYDQWLQAGITTITTFTAASVITTFIESTEGWPKIVALIMAAFSALLSAIRQGTNWGNRSETIRKQGAEWSKQRGQARDYVTHLLNGDRVAMEALDELAERDRTLLSSNQEITTKLYDECKDLKRREFNREYSFTSLNARHSVAAPEATPVQTAAPGTTPAQTAAPGTTPAQTAAPGTTPAQTAAPETTPAG